MARNSKLEVLEKNLATIRKDRENYTVPSSDFFSNQELRVSSYGNVYVASHKSGDKNMSSSKIEKLVASKR